MNRTVAFVVVCALSWSAGAHSQVSKSEWEEFKAQFAAMSERVRALEVENQKLRESNKRTIKVEDLAATNAEVDSLKLQNKEAAWAERIKWKGDFRFRYEEIDEEGEDNRERNRIRARPALVAKTSDTTVVGLGLATGSDDPVSTNQTLGGGASRKDINLDLAYATWTGLENTAITGGKFVNPYYAAQKNELIFDNDLRPEGVAASWANDMFFANSTFSFIESDTTVSGKDNYGIWATQLGAVLTPIDGAKLTLSAAYIDIPTAGQVAIYNNEFQGNSFVQEDGTDVYEYNYELVTGSIDLGIDVLDMPLNLYADYVENQDVDDLESGYLLGVQLGSAKQRGSWQVQYQYEELDANATLGLITNSDFAGGGTDVKGSMVSARYAIDDQWYVGSTYYFDNEAGVNLGDNLNYERFQLDTGLSY